MAHSVYLTPGAKGECQRCGFDYHLSDMRKEWTKARVCPECWDKKPEQLKPPRIQPEGLPKHNTSPPTEPNYISTNDHTRDDL